MNAERLENLPLVISDVLAERFPRAFVTLCVGQSSTHAPDATLDMAFDPGSVRMRAFHGTAADAICTVATMCGLRVSTCGACGGRGRRLYDKETEDGCDECSALGVVVVDPFAEEASLRERLRVAEADASASKLALDRARAELREIAQKNSPCELASDGRRAAGNVVFFSWCDTCGRATSYVTAGGRAHCLEHPGAVAFMLAPQIDNRPPRDPFARPRRLVSADEARAIRTGDVGAALCSIGDLTHTVVALHERVATQAVEIAALRAVRMEPMTDSALDAVCASEDRATADDPLLDATDGAHPAWWRGHDRATEEWRERVSIAERERDEARADLAQLADQQRPVDTSGMPAEKALTASDADVDALEAQAVALPVMFYGSSGDDSRCWLIDDAGNAIASGLSPSLARFVLNSRDGVPALCRAMRVLAKQLDDAGEVAAGLRDELRKRDGATLDAAIVDRHAKAIETVNENSTLRAELVSAQNRIARLRVVEEELVNARAEANEFREEQDDLRNQLREIRSTVIGSVRGDEYAATLTTEALDEHLASTGEDVACLVARLRSLEAARGRPVVGDDPAHQDDSSTVRSLARKCLVEILERTVHPVCARILQASCDWLKNNQGPVS